MNKDNYARSAYLELENYVIHSMRVLPLRIDSLQALLCAEALYSKYPGTSTPTDS